MDGLAKDLDGKECVVEIGCGPNCLNSCLAFK